MSRAIHCPWSVGAGIKIYLTKTLAKTSKSVSCQEIFDQNPWENQWKSMVPSDCTKVGNVFDKDTFSKTLGKTRKTLGSRTGTRNASLIKRYLIKTIGKTNGNQHFLQAWEFLSHRVPCPILNWNELKWIGEECSNLYFL